jgi:hypothetical protein
MPASKGWSRDFDEPIPLPNGSELLALGGTPDGRVPKRGWKRH